MVEDSTWEFKAIEFAGNRPRSPNRDDLANEITAFANADGVVLLCGVTDAGDDQRVDGRVPFFPLVGSTSPLVTKPIRAGDIPAGRLHMLDMAAVHPVASPGQRRH